MATPVAISQLQLTKPVNWSGMVESAKLTNAFAARPHELGVFLTKRFGSYYQKTLQLITGGLGNTKFIDSDTYRWKVMGDESLAVGVAAASPDATATTGIGHGLFRIVLLEKRFTNGDVLVSDNRDYLVQVKGEPTQDGSRWMHTVQLVTGDPTLFIPAALISPGARFSKQYTAVEEFSDRGGTISFTSGVDLENVLSTVRKSYTVTRSAATDRAYLDLVHPTEPGKRTKLWATMAEWKAYLEITKEIDNVLLYGKSNRTASGTYENFGANGRPVKMGAGLREQISPVNVRYYSTLSYGLLMEFLMDLSYNATSAGGNVKFVALTGRQGMMEFDAAMRREMGRLNLQISTGQGQFVTGSGQKLVFEGQFTTVKFLNGLELTVTQFDPYDNRTDNRELHPVTGMPVESYRFTVLNIGSDSNGEANIVKVAKRDSEMLAWHEGGSIAPSGGTVGNSLSTIRSSGRDGFEGHYLAEVGLMLKDPLSCGELIFSAE